MRTTLIVIYLTVFTSSKLW